MLFTLEVLAPLLLGLVLVSVAANVLQTGPLLSSQALKPQLKRISPISGVKRILGKQGLLALVRNLLKLSIVGGILALAPGLFQSDDGSGATGGRGDHEPDPLRGGAALRPAEA